MKFLKYALLFTAAYLLLSCSDDNNGNQPQILDETSSLILVKSIENQTHKIGIFTETGKLTDGYNKVFFQLKNKNDELITHANIRWIPLMHMQSMQHGAPHSEIRKVAGKQSIYEGWIVFQMPGNDMGEFWELKFEYETAGSSYEMAANMNVQSTSKKRVVSFVGSDNTKYIIGFVEPSKPKVAINDMTAIVFKMTSSGDFPIVNNYKVKIDPRMPGMGNHGTPNNMDLTQGADEFYHGKLSLSMTGYWIINLILENENGEILKGEGVTNENPKSSIFFEIDF